MLAVFACAMGSILPRSPSCMCSSRVLPQDGWKSLQRSARPGRALGESRAVKQTIGCGESAAAVLLADALVYSLWVLLLLSSGSFATRFNR